MRDLCRGVDTRIGAASSGDGMRAGFKLPQRGFHRPLHRRQASGLPLPARERAAVIFDLQSIAGHGLFPTPEAACGAILAN